MERDRRYRIETTIIDTFTEVPDLRNTHEFEPKFVSYFVTDVSSDAIEHDSELLAALTAQKIYHYVDKHLDKEGNYLAYEVKEF